MEPTCSYWANFYNYCAIKKRARKFVPKKKSSYTHGFASPACLSADPGTRPAGVTTAVATTQAPVRTTFTAASSQPPCTLLSEVGYYNSRLIRRVPRPSEVSPKTWRWCARECALEPTCSYWANFYNYCAIKKRVRKFVPKKKSSYTHGFASPACL